MQTEELKARLEELEELRSKLEDVRERSKLKNYEPTPKQAEFHSMGQYKRHRLLMAGNQTGKTFSAGIELAMHMTGKYPKWWTGKRWSRPINCWAAGVTGESTRDNPQRILLGRKRNWGTGTIPGELLLGTPTLSRGIPDGVDSFQVRHVNGGVSTCWFKSYERGREKWQGETLDLIWFDEEPPYDIYKEGLTRLNRLGGLSMITFTPLMGMTQVVAMFLEPEEGDPGNRQRGVVQMTLDDATFYKQEEREEIEAQYTDAEKLARTKGLPAMGEGLIYPVSDDEVSVEPFEVPDYYRQIIGIDFGFDHPTALVCMAYNPDNDTIYITDVYKKERELISTYADALKQRGAAKLPVAWPHDGLKTDPRSGKPLRDLYAEKGVRMLPESARMDPDKGGAQPREPIIQECLERMREGRLRVFTTCSEWFSEKNTYHRRDGKVVAERDDVMSAMHYGVMDLRHARPRYDTMAHMVDTVDTDYDPLEDF